MSANEESVLYELGFHLVPTIAEEDIQKEFTSIIKLIESNGGEITSKSEPTLLKLAYEMVKNVESKNYKYDSAYFGWVKFLNTTDNIASTKEGLDLHDNILRFIIIKSEEGPDFTSGEVAAMLNGDLEDLVEEPEEESTDDTDEETEEEVEEEPSKKQDIEEVDKVIDEMVS